MEIENETDAAELTERVHLDSDARIYRQRIAYFSDLEFPSNSVATKQMLKTVEALRKQHVSIELFLPIPWARLAMADDERLSDIKQYYGLSDQVRFREIPSPLPMIKRLHRPLFSYLALNKICSSGYDIVYVRNVLHLRMALARGARVIFETYRYIGAEKANKKVVELLNGHDNFLGVIVHSELTRHYLISLGAVEEKIITIHNGIDEKEIPPRMHRENARNLLNLPHGQKMICYAGNMDPTKYVESVVELARLLPEIHFYLVGAKRKWDLRRLQKFAKKIGAGNLTFIPWLPPTKVHPYLFAADALIIPPTAKPLLEGGNTVLPLKTFMYLATGVPILAPALPDTAEILHHKENSFLLSPDMPNVNVWEIRELFLDGGLMDRISTNALESAKSFTWDHRAEKIVAFIEERLGCHEING